MTPKQRKEYVSSVDNPNDDKEQEEPPPRHNVANILEARALEIDRLAWLPFGEWSPLSIVRRQISHTLDQIERIKEVHDRAKLGLLRLECYVDTDLMRLDAPINRSPNYFLVKDRFKVIERDRLKERLFRIDEERRKLAMSQERELQSLHDRLLELFNRYWQLQG